MTRNQLVALLILLLLAVLAAIGCVVYRAQMARVMAAIGLERVNAHMPPGTSTLLCDTNGAQVGGPRGGSPYIPTIWPNVLPASSGV